MNFLNNYKAELAKTLFFLFLICGASFAQNTDETPPPSVADNGICELPLFEDWSFENDENSNSPCACTWVDEYNVRHCSYGNCGEAYKAECRSDDCAGFKSAWKNLGSNKGFELCISFLPVEFASFDGNAIGTRIDLQWATLSETNNSHFEVLYSTNARDFIKLTDVPGLGDSQEYQEYIFNHHNVERGIHYYQLRQVDFDGQAIETKIIAVDNRENFSNQHFSNVYPNPSEDGLNFSYYGNQDKDISVEILSSTGQVVYGRIVSGNEIYNEISVDLTSVSKGVYILKLTQGDVVELKRISIIK